MDVIPQLRVRTEYSFRRCYGPVPIVAKRLAEIECPAAGMVDVGGTWGHVQWSKAIPNPLFGREFDGWWALAEDLPSFYRLSSLGNPTMEQLAACKGVVRFAGAVLTDPETFDYVDINPRSRLLTDRAMKLAKRTGRPVVLTSDNDYPGPGDQQRFLAWDDSKKMTPQYILSDSDFRAAFSWLDKSVFKKAVKATNEAAERCAGLKLNKAPLISVEGDLAAQCEVGKAMRLARGHIKSWTPEYEARLQRELVMIRQKSYESYFLVVADMICWAKDRMLVGPARGSSAGSLVCYLTRITEVDPIAHGLLFERFIDVTRSDLPDIDVDFNDQKREQVFAYLGEKYGADHVARIGSVNRLKPRSLMAHVGKKLGLLSSETFPVLNVLVEYSSGDTRYGNGLKDTLTGTKPGKDFAARYPAAATLMPELEEHASHSGVHAAGIIISNHPVSNYCTVIDGVAQIDKKDAEQLQLLKIDALGLRTLGVLEDSGCVTSQQLYDLPLDDPAVFRIFNDGKFSGIFQFEGPAQRRVSVQIPVRHFDQIDHITALARPGPLGGGATDSYIRRNRGQEEITYRHPSMAAYLENTMGVVLYQEQVMRISSEIGKFSWADVSIIRRAMSGSKGKEFFDRYGKQFLAGAATIGMSAEEAQSVWDTICTFGAWGMNKSHTVSYSIISYWCAWMKHYHPLEYAAACLRNAKDDEQTLEVLRELRDEGVPYTPFDIDRSGTQWAVTDGQLVGGWTNLHGIGPAKAAQYLAKRDAGKLTDADRAKIAAMPVKHSELRPAHAMWGEIYRNPSAHNINGRVFEFGELEDGDNAVVICQLIRLERRDENETLLVARRGGKVKTGQTLFLDAFVVDDSITKPARLRLRSPIWKTLGEKMADRAQPKVDWFLVRGRWLGQFSMMICEKIKCLTNPEMFQ